MHILSHCNYLPRARRGCLLVDVGEQARSASKGSRHQYDC